MLTRVYIDNFRSFVNFEYRPEAKQLLLGPNGSGKSSLLDVIRYVKDFLDGAENPFTQSTRTRWLDNPLQVVEIEASLEGEKYEYRLETLSTPRSLKLENLKINGKPVFEFSNGQIHFFRNDSSEATVLPYETSRSALHLSQLSNSYVGRFLSWMQKSVYVFSVDVYPGTMNDIADGEEQQPDWELDNMAGFYRYLVGARPEENARFLSSMRESLDGLQNLRFSSEEEGVSKLRADFTAPAGKRVSFWLSELSEGQRKLLALFMLLHFFVEKGCTIFIDEPDNYVALRELQPWLLAAEAAVEDHNAQLILVSHHPEMLNQWAPEYGLRFFREENGPVRVKPFDGDGYLQPAELVARGWESE
jgi:predicted ATPase